MTCLAAFAAALTFCGENLSAQIYSNPGFIRVPDTSGPNPATMGPASSYPSTITINGAPGSIGHIRVNINNLSHAYAGDVVALLVAPNGARIKLFETSSGATISNVNLSFTSDATAQVPYNPVSGIYAPTGGSYVLPNSGANEAGSPNFDPIINSNPNGTWSLYLYDRAAGDIGVVEDGWSIELAEGNYPLGGFIYQGRIDGAEPGDSVSLRFTPWDAAVSNASQDRLGNSVTVATTVGDDGTIAVPVDFGFNLPTDRRTFLQVEVASPAGGTFTSLSPRQPVGPSPLAARAVSARTADEVAGVNVSTVVKNNASNTFTADQVIATGSILAFGSIGNRAGTADNTDFIAFNRVNPLSNISELRLILGDDPTGSVDSFSIGTSSNETNFDARFIFKTDGNAFKPGGGAWSSSSDRRLKHDIMPLEGSLDRLLGLRGVTFEYNDPKRAGACEGTMTGFIAQDVEPIFPRWVSTDAEGYKAITITGFEALTVEALRELRKEKDAQIAEKDEQIAELREQVQDLYQRLERLEMQGK